MFWKKKKQKICASVNQTSVCVLACCQHYKDIRILIVLWQCQLREAKVTEHWVGLGRGADFWVGDQLLLPG